MQNAVHAINPLTSDNPTEQEIFDTAYIGVVRQGVPSVTADGRCAYRGVNGTACGVGHLVHDATARYWDTHSAPAISTIIAHGISGSERFYGHRDLLEGIQKAHDSANSATLFGDDFITSFMTRMGRLAEAYELTIPDMGAVQ